MELIFRTRHAFVEKMKQNAGICHDKLYPTGTQACANTSPLISKIHEQRQTHVGLHTIQYMNGTCTIVSVSKAMDFLPVAAKGLTFAPLYPKQTRLP